MPGVGERVFQGQEIAFALGHFLAAGNDQKSAVHPEVEKFLSGGGFGLGDFVGVVHVDVVGPAAMDIEHARPEISCSWPSIRCASRESPRPRANPIPSGAERRRGEFPQGEIGGIAFLRVFFHPGAFLQGFDRSWWDSLV
jgi:hypothetical protein